MTVLVPGDTRVVSLAPAWERYYTLDPASLALAVHETPEREPCPRGRFRRRRAGSGHGPNTTRHVPAFD